MSMSEDTIFSALVADAAMRAKKAAEDVARSLAAEEADRLAAQAAYNARSDKQKHDDEVAGQRRWVNNPMTASYFWLVIKDGVVHSREWSDDCECVEGRIDPSGHTLPISAFPQVPYMLCAEPIAPMQALPKAHELVMAGHAYEINEGDTPIWEHRVRWFHYADGTADTEEDALVFGVRHSDGSEEISTVDHDGFTMKHLTRADALAHVKE